MFIMKPQKEPQFPTNNGRPHSFCFVFWMLILEVWASWEGDFPKCTGISEAYSCIEALKPGRNKGSAVSVANLHTQQCVYIKNGPIFLTLIKVKYFSLIGGEKSKAFVYFPNTTHHFFLQEGLSRDLILISNSLDAAYWQPLVQISLCSWEHVIDIIRDEGVQGQVETSHHLSLSL